MLEIITLNKKDDDSNNKLWKGLLIDSFNKFYKQNNYRYEIKEKSNLKEFWSFLDLEEVHIVLKQNKFIGFFINKIHTSNQEISFQLFSHPLSCPMSLRSITKAALFRSFMLFLDSPGEFTNLEFITWHPSLVTIIKTFIPDVEITMINSNNIICYKAVNYELLTSFRVLLLKYLDLKDIQQYNKNQYKILY